MLRDIRDYADGAAATADVVVVGSGIAGCEVALSLARRGRDVLLIESGREAFDRAIQALNAVEFLGKPHRAQDAEAGYHSYLAPELRGVSRVRQLGGTSNVWTGKWKHLQPGDFAGRDWVPASAWPIGYDDLLPHYRAAAEAYGFRDLEAEAGRAEIVALRGAVGAAGLKVTSFYWEETPTRTAVRFGADMRGSERLTVVTGATATEIRLDERGGRVVEIDCRSLDGRRLTARGARFVLATGGLETPRLLLASRGRRPEGIGNAHDLVGRFYSDHPKHHAGVLSPGPLTKAFAAELQYAPKPRFCTCFALSDALQRAHRLLEHVVYLKPIYSRRWKPLARLMRGGDAVEDANGLVSGYRVKFVTEQAPNRESRVTLGSEPDALGVPKTRLDWRFTDADHASVERTLALIEAGFASAGLGRFDWGGARPDLDGMTDAAHQMGTTRMGARPEEGVVDTDCRVFGTENLYIAGSAVFPTGPSYSPTFTILALARRLAEHLVRAEAPRKAAVTA